MNKCAAITLLGVLVGAGTAATADDVRTEIYGEGATTGGPKTLYWDIYTAEAGGEGRALVLLHGGGCRDGSRNDRRLVELAQQLAQDGITVVSPDYRLLADSPSPGPYSVASMAEAASEIWLPDILATETAARPRRKSFRLASPPAPRRLKTPWRHGEPFAIARRSLDWTPSASHWAVRRPARSLLLLRPTN